MLIRNAESLDAADMKICVEAAYRHYVPRIGKPPEPMLYDYSEVVRCHQAFVAVDKGQIVGVLVLTPGSEEMLLDNVAVHPDHQGIGLGRKLLQLAEEEARKQGFASLILFTHELMTENIELYEKIGYVETDRRTETEYARVYMKKSLT